MNTTILPQVILGAFLGAGFLKRTSLTEGGRYFVGASYGVATSIVMHRTPSLGLSNVSQDAQAISIKICAFIAAQWALQKGLKQVYSLEVPRENGLALFIANGAIVYYFDGGY